jgi:hypothetical protein
VVAAAQNHCEHHGKAGTGGITKVPKCFGTFSCSAI